MADLDDLVTRLASARCDDTGLSCQLGIGLRDVPQRGETSWLKVPVQGGAAQPPPSSDLRVLSSDAQASTELDVSIAISATGAVWDDLYNGGPDAVTTAAKKQQLFMSGDLPLFVT